MSTFQGITPYAREWILSKGVLFLHTHWDSPHTRARVDTLVVAKIATTKKGERLTAIKSTLQHGQWIPWIVKNLPFDVRQAQKYMSIFGKKELLNTNQSSHLTINEAVNLLATPKPKKEPIPVQAEIDRQAAMDWIDRNQIGRRNLTGNQLDLVMSRIYERKKQKHGGERGNQYTEQASGKNCHLADKGRTREVVGRELGVSARTVENAAKFGKAIDTLGELG